MSDNSEASAAAEPPPAPRVRRIGLEASRTIERKMQDGFVAKYLSGAAILDIGYRGYDVDVDPVVPQAIGVELDYPGYDGRTLPFGDQTQDAVFSSHCLEHIADYRTALREWHRVLKVGGFMIIAVPHKYLYERRTGLPSRWNGDHKRFYTPGSLMSEIEESLVPNTYRLRHLIDNDLWYDYSVPPNLHAGGCYEVEMVLERIAPPAWTLEEMAGGAAAQANSAEQAEASGPPEDFLPGLYRRLRSVPRAVATLLNEIVVEQRQVREKYEARAVAQAAALEAIDRRLQSVEAAVRAGRE